MRDDKSIIGLLCQEGLAKARFYLKKVLSGNYCWQCLQLLSQGHSRRKDGLGKLLRRFRSTQSLSGGGVTAPDNGAYLDYVGRRSS